MQVWGHSYEFDGFMSDDPDKDWGYLETFCQAMHNRPEIYFTTTLDLVDYLNAVRALANSLADGTVRNPARRNVWLMRNGQLLALEPGQILDRVL